MAQQGKRRPLARSDHRATVASSLGNVHTSFNQSLEALSTISVNDSWSRSNAVFRNRFSLKHSDTSFPLALDLPGLTCKMTALSEVVCEGYTYRTLHEHPRDSTLHINEGGRFRKLDDGWEPCPADANAINVCSQHSWGAHLLVFADGSTYATASGPKYEHAYTAGKASCIPCTAAHACFSAIIIFVLLQQFKPSHRAAQ